MAEAGCTLDVSRHAHPCATHSCATHTCTHPPPPPRPPAGQVVSAVRKASSCVWSPVQNFQWWKSNTMGMPAREQQTKIECQRQQPLPLEVVWLSPGPSSAKMHRIGPHTCRLPRHPPSVSIHPSPALTCCLVHLHEVHHRVQAGPVVVLNSQPRLAVGAQPLVHNLHTRTQTMVVIVSAAAAAKDQVVFEGSDHCHKQLASVPATTQGQV